MTPEEISQERSKRLRSAFLDQEFGGAKALINDNAFGGVIEDKESFLTSSAVAGWAGVALNRHVNPASSEWQGIKDGIARGYFKNQTASNVSDNDMFGMIAADYQAQDKVASAARMAAARGESWLGKFRELEVKESGNMISGRTASYLGLARAAHDEMAAKVNPYRKTIKTVAEMARNINTAPDGMNWGAMASELIKVPKEDRPYVLEALSLQTPGESGFKDAETIKLAFMRGMERYLDNAASSLVGGSMAEIEASAMNNPLLTNMQSGEVLAASSTIGDYMDLRDDMRDIATGKLAPLNAVRIAGMNISGAVENVPMTIGSFVPYVGAAVTLGSFQRSTYNEIRRSNPTMSREDANSIATMSAPIQAITEIASDRFLFGRLPNLKRAFTQPIFSTAGALAMFTTRAAIGTAIEVGEEFAQGITPLAVQSIAKALGEDLPGSDWDGFLGEFAQNMPELISTILPLAIVGAGTGQLSDFRAGRQMARSADMLIAAQYSPEAAVKISDLANASRWGEAEDAMRTDWANINAKGANVSQVKATAEQRVQAANRLKSLQAEQANVDELQSKSPEYTASVTRTPTGWQVTTGEGTVIPVESAEAAQRIAVDLRQVGSQEEADTLVAVIDSYYEQGKQAETVFTGEDVQASKEIGVVGIRRDAGNAVISQRQFGPKALETVREEAEVAGIKSNTRGVFAHINGSNEVFPMRVADGAKEIVRRMNLYKSQAEGQPQVITFLHENFESTWRLGMENGTFSEQETRTAMRALLPAFEGVTALNPEEAQFIDNLRTLASGKGNETMLRETVSEMVIRDVLGRDRQGRATGMKPGSISRAIEASVMGANTQEEASALKSILAAIKAFTAYLKGVFGTVDAMIKANEEGKIGEDWDSFVNKVLGIDEVKQMESQTVDEVKAMLGIDEEVQAVIDAGNMAFSTSRAQLPENGAISFSVSPTSTIAKAKGIPSTITPEIAKEFKDRPIATGMADLIAASGSVRDVEVHGGSGYPVEKYDPKEPKKITAVWASMEIGIRSILQGLEKTDSIWQDAEGKHWALFTPYTMKQEAHKSNAQTPLVYFSKINEMAKNGAISSTRIANISEHIRKTVSSASKMPNFGTVDIKDFIDEASFETRADIIDELSTARSKDLGAPSPSSILTETRDPQYQGSQPNAITSLLLIDIDRLATKEKDGSWKLRSDLSAADFKVTPHPSYNTIMPGRVLVHFDQPIPFTISQPEMIRTMKEASPKSRPEYLTSRIPPNKGIKFQTLTADIINKINEVQKLKGSLPQIKAVVNAVNGGWKTFKEGQSQEGLKEFTNAINRSPAKESLTQYDPKDVSNMIKKGVMTVHQLGDLDVWFGVKKRDDGNRELVSVVNNTGIPGMLNVIMAKALEEGVNRLDASSVVTPKMPNGLLPTLYANHGWKESERAKYNRKYLLEKEEGESDKSYKQRLAEKEAALKMFWKEQGWDGQAMPDIVFMEHDGIGTGTIEDTAGSSVAEQKTASSRRIAGKTPEQVRGTGSDEASRQGSTGGESGIASVSNRGVLPRGANSTLAALGNPSDTQLEAIGITRAEFNSFVQKSKGSVTYSISPAQDAEYLAAAKAGDTETAQRLVDDAAKAAGFTVGPVWHGSNSPFNIFDRKKAKEGRFGKGFYFTPDEASAKNYGNESVRVRGGELTLRQFYLKGDTFNYKDAIRVAFDPSQIKSADPITYDDAGNIIPLSQRFNEATPDIRFSISPVRNLNELSDQVERQFAENPVGALEVKSRVIRQFAKLADKWSNERWTPQGNKIRPISEKRTVKSLDKEQAMRQARALDEILANQGFTSADAMRSKDAKDYEAWQRFQESKDLLLSGGMTEEEAKKLAGASASTWRKNFVNAIREATKKAKAEAQAWRDETDAMQKEDWSPKESLVRDLITLEAIVAMFPQEIRGKIGGFVALARKASEAARLKVLQKQLERGQVLLEKHLKEQYGEAVDKLFDKYRPERKAGEKPKGKLDPDAQEISDKAEMAMKLSADQANAEIAAINVLLDADNISAEEEAKLEAMRELVQLLGDWKNASSARRESAFIALNDVLTEGWAKWKLKQLLKREQREEMRKMLKSATGKKGVASERDKMKKDAAKVLGKADRWVLNLSSFSEVMRAVFGENASRQFVDDERNASNQYEDAIQEFSERIDEFFTTLSGGVLRGERLRFDLAQPTLTVGAGGMNERNISQLQSIQALLMWQQEDGRRHMEGPRDENGAPIEGKWSYDQAWIDELTSKLSPEALEVKKFLEQLYSEEWVPLNAVYRERHGVNLPRHDKYAPITVTPQQAKAGEMVDPVSGAAVAGSILTPGSLRSRNRSALAEPEFRDALSTFIAHTKQMEHWKAYYDLAVEMQSVLGNRDVSNSVKAAVSDEGVTVLRKWIDVFAQGGTRDAAAGLAISSGLSKLAGRVATVGLLGRFSTLLVQSTQLAAASVKMPLGSYLKRFSMLMSGNLQWSDAINSEFIQRRIKSAPPLVSQAMQGLGEATRPNEIKRVTRYLGQLLSGADGLFTAGTYAILLDYHRTMGVKMGMQGEALESYAHAEAVNATEQVAQPVRTGTRSIIEVTNTNPLAKMSWAYASEARQKMALFAWSAYNAKNDPAGTAKTAFLVFVVGGLMSQVLKNLWREAKGDDDEKKWSPERLAMSLLSPITSAIPGAAMIAGEGGSLSGAQYTKQSIKDVFDGKADMKDVDTILSAMGYFNDTAGGIATLSHAGYDFAQLLDNAFGED